jgi:hypothetical protein
MSRCPDIQKPKDVQRCPGQYRVARFTRVFSDRVEPYSNDRGCHRLLLTGDSPTSPGSEYVNMLNRIDREVC